MLSNEPSTNFWGLDICMDVQEPASSCYAALSTFKLLRLKSYFEVSEQNLRMKCLISALWWIVEGLWKVSNSSSLEFSLAMFTEERNQNWNENQICIKNATVLFLAQN